MAVTFSSLSSDRFNALLIASVHGSKPACSTFSLSYAHTHVCVFERASTSGPHTLLTVNPQSIFHGALARLFRKLIGHTFHRLMLEGLRGAWR